MKVHATALVLAAGLACLPAQADAPRVATDLLPVHSLVARVMQGVGEPDLILPPGTSPHGYSMRPSEAVALARADLVVWMGAALAPWMQRAVATLPPDAVSLELLEVEGSRLLGYREGAEFAHAHGDVSHGDEPKGEDDDHDAHGHSAGHAAHGAVDPHAWLDPENARTWLSAIAARLAELDPANAPAYAANAEGGRIELASLTAEIAETIEPARGRPFIVFHDAYHYFEHRFGLEAAGAISLGDASPPSAARIAETREGLQRLRARCVFAEPQFPTRLVDVVIEGTEARAAVLDPLGAGLEPGPALYPMMMRALARDLSDCLAAGG